jgi:hypothetical protein
LPRRYRPPTRRRKSKTRYGEDSTDVSSGDASLAAAPYSPPPAASAPPVAADRSEPHIVRHIARDHTYVLGEVRLIGLLVAFIMGGLIITAILR